MKKHIYWFLPTALFALIMFVSSWNMPLWMDEYIFYKLSLNLPNYTSYADWLFVDRPSTINPMDIWSERTTLPLNRDESLRWIYDNKVYYHTPLAPALVWPLVKTLDTLADHNVISHIEDQPGYPKIPDNATDDQMQQLYHDMKAETITKILRIVPIVLFMITSWLAYKLLFKKVGSSAYAFAIPIAACYQLLSGVYLFYWDVFMMFFFVLTLYLMDRKSKWAYVTACCMVNTKMFIGLLFLLPLLVKNWKMIFTGLSLVPFYLVIAFANGDILYPFIHYVTGQGGVMHSYVYHLYDLKGYIVLLISLGTPLFLLMTVPIFWRIKKYPEYVVLLLVGNIYAWGSGLGIAHLSSLVYVGALIFPLVVHEFNLYNKGQKMFDWFQLSKSKA